LLMRKNTLSNLFMTGIVLTLAAIGCEVRGTRVPLETYRKPAEPGVFENGAIPAGRTYADTSYKIGKLDKIDVYIAEHPEFSGPLKVQSNGTISMPILDKTVFISGLNTSQAEARIWEAIESFVIGKPMVKVQIRQSRSRFFIALGAIRRRGKFFIGLEDITVRDALLNAQLWRAGANKDNIYIITPDTEKKPTYVVVDGGRIMRGDLRQNVVLRPGDILFVPTTIYFKINQVLDEIIGQAGKVESVETDVLKYGKSVNETGYGSLPPED